MTDTTISKRLWSTENAKAAKAASYGWINAIHYLAPSDFAGGKTLCANASPGCIALCLGWFSGQAAMVPNQSNRDSIGNVRLSRIKKVQALRADPDAYLRAMLHQAQAIERKAWQEDVAVAFRADGSSDWKLALKPFEAPEIGRTTLADALPQSRIVEYTKNAPHMIKFLCGHYPGNVHLTFSRSETNEADCRRVLDAGGNVAVVFRDRLPDVYLGAPVIDGDEHDLRHLDPAGVVVGLVAKGQTAKRDTSGFVVNV